jgi:hypothetical protein
VAGQLREHASVASRHAHDCTEKSLSSGCPLFPQTQQRASPQKMGHPPYLATWLSQTLGVVVVISHYSPGSLVAPSVPLLCRRASGASPDSLPVLVYIMLDWTAGAS